MWSNATFEFVETPPEEGLFDDIRDAQYEPIEVAHMIMEAAHRIDEWDRMLQNISGMQEVMVFDEALKAEAQAGAFELTDSEMKVMRTMNASRDLEDIVQINAKISRSRSSRSRYFACGRLFKRSCEGFVFSSEEYI